MSNPSNLYAEKIFSEHPLVLWALDDQADYISLITEQQRDIESEWVVTGGTAEASVGFAGQPFGDSITTILEGSVPAGQTNDIICISPNLLNFQNLNSTLGTFLLDMNIQILRHLQLFKNLILLILNYFRVGVLFLEHLKYQMRIQTSV
jgi:hypothetical protein